MKTSLAQFISQTRETEGLSITGLARKANLKPEVIEAIEEGQELFLATTVRQKLAKALKISLGEIKELEKTFDDGLPDEFTIDELKYQIKQGAKTLVCPQCQEELVCHVEKMFDLEDNLIFHPKARCSKCPFQIK